MNETKVLAYIREMTTPATLDEIRDSRRAAGVTAGDIEKQLHMYRSNASTILNGLVKKGELLKVESRPVYFLPVDLVAAYTGAEPAASYTPEEFVSLLRPGEAAPEEAGEEDPFSLLVGADMSLAPQVEQAKAAVLYPPNGLHTLIIGESGIGKTLFARTMYNYGRIRLGRDRKKFPFVEFNCSDYYHNPQLLMSHLFGYVKGAFTGAAEDTPGLVEKADGGILFLDEVHRLPPEGQELLFYLIDTGCYRKLGESGHVRHAKVLIIAATTEDPRDVLLRTFIRRIPLTITLPAFRERPVEERLRLVEDIFVRESTATQKNYVISPRVIKALVGYAFPANIGELSSEIKVLCARSFLNSSGAQDDLEIQFEHLSAPVREAYRSRGQTEHLPPAYDSEITITPSSSVLYAQNKLPDEKSYLRLMESIGEYTKKGYTKEEMNEVLADKIEAYYTGVLRRLHDRQIHREEIYKVVDREIVDFTIEAMEGAAERLDMEVSQKDILVMAFHLKYLLERQGQEKTITPSEIRHMEQEYAGEIGQAEAIVERLRARFDVVVSAREKYFLAILLANTGAGAPAGGPALLIVAHGRSTASSMAEVCNRLMDCAFVRAVDAPLDQSVRDTYGAVLRQVRRCDPEKGVVLLVDMGSLTEFGRKITEETGIPTWTIPNVTTLMALDLTRKLLGKEEDIDRLCRQYLDGQRPPGAQKKRQAILSVCASGTGTSEAMKHLLEQELEAHGLPVTVVALGYNEVRQEGPRYRQVLEQYDAIACVGNIQCDIDMPFFHVSRLISDQDKADFIKFVSGLALAGGGGESGGEGDLLGECRQFLAKNVTFLNPEVAVRYAARFLDRLDEEKVAASRNLQMSLILHLAFMLERNICGNKVVFDNEAEYLAENRALYDKLRAGMHILEEPFDVEVNDSEICYIIRTIRDSE